MYKSFVKMTFFVFLWFFSLFLFISTCFNNTFKMTFKVSSKIWFVEERRSTKKNFGLFWHEILT